MSTAPFNPSTTPDPAKKMGPDFRLVIVHPDQIEAYLYALGGLADNEHDKGCDEAFCNYGIEAVVEKLTAAKEQKLPVTVCLDFYERFTLHAAADIFSASADEVCETPNTENWLIGACNFTGH